MDPMDYQMDHDRSLHNRQNPHISRCPYRPLSDGSNLQFHSTQPQNFAPTMPPFASMMGTPQAFWENMRSIQTQDNMNQNRFGPPYISTQQGGRAPELARFDSFMDLESNGHRQQPILPHPRQPHPAEFHGIRHRMQTQGNNSTSHQNSGMDEQAAGSTSMGRLGMPETAPSFDGANYRPNETSNPAAGQQSSTSSPNTVPGLNLPPPNSYIPDIFAQHHQHVPFYHQIQFTPDRSVPFTTPHSSHVQNTRLSTGSRRNFTPVQPNMSSQHSEDRAWFHDTYYSQHFADGDSDDDSLDALGEDLFRERDLRLARASRTSETAHMSLAARRSAYALEMDETMIERARAARRAAAAAVKLVASSSALAALEKVEMASLVGDDRNCIICYNEFGIKNPDGFIETAVRLPKCKHIFGDHCLKQWLKDSDTCPYCRDKLPSEPKRNPPSDDVRRLIAHTRAHGMPSHLTPWGAAEIPVGSADRATYMAALERESRYQQLIQHRLRREPYGAETDSIEDIHARGLRRHDDWAGFASQSHQAYPHRSMPDHDPRRRFRARPNSSRNQSQNSVRPTTTQSVRSPRHPNQHPTLARTPSHSNQSSFDDSNSPRSITPHPTLLATSTQSQSHHTGDVRPSSLPSETSPLREVVGTSSWSPIANGSSNSTSGTNLPSPLREAQRTNAEFLHSPSSGWELSGPNLGRPVSVPYSNEVAFNRLPQIFGGNMEGNESTRRSPLGGSSLEWSHPENFLRRQ